MSADPSLREQCFRGAKFLLRLLEGVGAEVKMCQPVEDKNPVGGQPGLLKFVVLVVLLTAVVQIILR